MTQITGESLTRLCRCLRPTLSIIMGTGFSYTMDAAKAAELGINAFLMKPWTARELLQAVARVLSPPRSMD